MVGISISMLARRADLSSQLAATVSAKDDV
jgi:hypothetical protein